MEYTKKQVDKTAEKVTISKSVLLWNKCQKIRRTGALWGIKEAKYTADIMKFNVTM